MNLDSEFSDFIGDISLSKTQKDRIDSAVGSLTKYLQDYFNVDDSNIFLQGSVATETVVRPCDKDGEYDVDMVIIIGYKGSDPLELLGFVENALKANDTYKDKVVEGADRPCVRLQYADESSAKFHVDIVPAREGEYSPLQIPTRDGKWKDTAPKEYVDWSLSHPDDYRDLVKAFKRWRDVHEIDIPSIVLQVVVADAYEQLTSTSFTELVADCFSKMHDRFSTEVSIPVIANPVIDENLAEKVEDDDFDNFQEKIAEAFESSQAASAEDDKEAAVALWQSLFGEGFKSVEDEKNLSVLSPNEISMTLGDATHRVIPTWDIVKNEYTANILATATWSFEKSVIKPRAKGNIHQTMKFSKTVKIVSGAVVHKGLQLLYQVHTNVPKPYEVYWQVVNTGEDAKNDLRGELKIRGGSRIDESTRYTGTHWVEAFIVKDNVCYAQSGRFYIHIP